MTSTEDFGKAMFKLSPGEWIGFEKVEILVGEGIFRVGRRRDTKWETAGVARLNGGETRVVLVGGNVSFPPVTNRCCAWYVLSRFISHHRGVLSAPCN